MAPSSKRRKLSNGVSAPTTLTTEPSKSLTAPSSKEDQLNAPPQTRSSSLFVRSLPSTVTKDTLAAHFSESYPLKHATVVLDPATKISRGFGFVTFTDPADAAAAATEFDGSTLQGRRIRVEIAEARHRDADELTITAAAATANANAATTLAGRSTGDIVDLGQGETIIKRGAKNSTGVRLRKEREDQKKESRPPRLIVRNLPWSIRTPEELGKLFMSYGKVQHAVVPKRSSGGGVGGRQEGYGFGIVILRGKKNAERALREVNGKEVDGRVIAVDWMAEKDEWEKVKKEAEEEQEQEEEELNGGEVSTADAFAADEEDEMHQHGDAAAEAIDTDDDDEDDKNADFRGSISSESDADKLADLDDNLDNLDPEPEKPSTDNTTIFIRNLPYTTDDVTLREHFTTHFGPTRYARVVYDPTTERSKGTGFVCFVDEDTARDCVVSAPKKPAFDDTMAASSVLHGGRSRQSNNQATAHSILQNDAQDPTGQYTLDGRVLQVSRAVAKATADARTQQGAHSRERARERDKRRLYLLSEGTVPRGSKLHEMLSKAELDMREASAKQRQKLIKVNPNLGLSLTRLSVRNLPRWVSSKDLKALAREAIVGFAEDVKQGKRVALSAEENRRGGDEMRELEKQRKKKGVGIVKQAKVVFEGKEGGKVKEGMGGRSRGYGFVEYWSHRAALGGLRWLNGYVLKGKEEGERGKRLIVEFAIENAQVVQRREGRERRVHDKRQADGAGAGIGARREGEFEFGKEGRLKGGNKRKRGEETPKTDKVVSVKQVVDGEEKNKIAKRNRIISKKRFARKARKG